MRLSNLHKTMLLQPKNRLFVLGHDVCSNMIDRFWKLDNFHFNVTVIHREIMIFDPQSHSNPNKRIRVSFFATQRKMRTHEQPISPCHLVSFNLHVTVWWLIKLLTIWIVLRNPHLDLSIVDSFLVTISTRGSFTHNEIDASRMMISPLSFNYIIYINRYFCLGKIVADQQSCSR